MPAPRRQLNGIATLLLAAIAILLAGWDPWPWFSGSLIVVGVLAGTRRPADAACLLMASYPMLDFTPWAGQWAMRHHDFLALGICAGWCGFRWNHASGRSGSFSFAKLSCLYLSWATISAVIGYAWLSRYGDAGAIVHLSPGNAWRSVKGVWLAFAIVACYPQAAGRDDSLLVAMSRGAPFALIYIGCWCIFERVLFIGWGDWNRYFRIGGPMSGASNLGGQASEAVVLVMMVWSLLRWQSSKHRWVKPLVAMGLLFGAASLVLMQTRSALAVMLLAGLMILVAHLINANHDRRRRVPLLIGSGGLVIAVLVILSVPAIRTRLHGVTTDTRLRLNQYRLVLSMMPQNPAKWFIGTGAGTLPTLFATNAPRERVPGWFSVTPPALDGDEIGAQSLVVRALVVRALVVRALVVRALVVRGGSSGYLGWSVGELGSDATKVRLKLRSSEPAAIGVHLCEKNLTQSVGCRNGTATGNGDGVWSWQEVRLSPRRFERPRHALGPLEINRPLFLSLGTPSSGKEVEIAVIELLTDDGRVQWATADFRPGLPDAFMTTDDYFPFHLESDALNLLIEQGIIGLGLLLSLFIRAIRESNRQVKETRVPLLVLFLVLALFGLINSPSDTPEPFALAMILLFALDRGDATRDCTPKIEQSSVCSVALR